MSMFLRTGSAVLLLSLAGCSGSGPGAPAMPASEVASVMPVRRTFHTHVAAFGQLAADSRGALALSLPQAGEVVATDAIAGRRVQRGTALLQLVTDPGTRSAFLQAQSALQVAQADLARSEQMHAQKLATNAQLDAARKTLADARAVFDAQARLGGAQASVTLAAPADGVVSALDVQRGERVAAGTTLVKFTPTAALAAQLGVDPEAASGIRAGMPVRLRPVYAAHGAQSVPATVAMVGAAVDSQSRLVNLVATLDAPVQLAAGTALAANITTSDFSAWAVPRAALQTDAGGNFIYQIEHGKAHRVDVRVVAPDGTPIGVAGPLDPRAPVITLGSYELADGDAVTSTATRVETSSR